MFNICKSHSKLLTINQIYYKLRFDLSNGFVNYLNQNSRNNFQNIENNKYLNSRYLSIKAKEENNNNLLEEQINQLNRSNSLLLFSPKWRLMYDVFYSGKCIQINDDFQKETKTKDQLINKNDNNLCNSNSINLLNASEEWKKVEPLTTSSLLKYYTQLAKLRLTGISFDP